MRLHEAQGRVALFLDRIQDGHELTHTELSMMADALSVISVETLDLIR